MNIKRKLIYCFISVILCFSMTGCGESDVANRITNALQSENENVLAVKNGSPYAYPDKTYGQAFENFFASPTWEYFVGTKEGSDEDGDGKPDYTEDNIDIVEFTGYCTYQDVKVKALIQFTLDKDAGSFEATYLSFNDVPQNYLMIMGLMEAVFTDRNLEVDKTENQEQTVDDDYALLEEFIELICSYSDPPDCEGDELQEYFKRQYDIWKSYEGYTNITVDNTGHLIIEDHSDEYVGNWWDTYSERCSMNITCNDGIYYYIDINWSSSASENTHWSCVGTYDSLKKGIYYYGEEIQEVYMEDGSIKETYVYTSGEGLIYIGDTGMLYWDDYVENAGADCSFVKN